MIYILAFMEEVTLQDFARNLRRLMEAKNINQVELARRSDIRQQTISSYCRAEVFPSFNRMVRIARALGVSFFDLTMQSPGRVNRELAKLIRRK